LGISSLRTYRHTDTPLEFVQVFGERNSGTSYLSKLLQDNLANPLNLLGTAKSEATPHGSKYFGYKHWFPDWEKLADTRQNRTLFVVIYRNPYTWVRAMMARPYALANSIGGRTVAELPKTKLVGHINGRDTTNEFHPTTGKHLTLFQLRTLKLEQLEALQSKVSNVAYVNLEQLLRSPAEAVQTLTAKFGSVFSQEPVACRTPPKQLVRETVSPLPFSRSEATVINNCLNWDAEFSIGYEKDNTGLKAGVY